MTAPTDEYVAWLESNSMLHAAKARARLYAGNHRQWLHPYAESRPRDAVDIASVWLNVYPGSILTQPGQSVLQALGDDRLWQCLSDVGIQAVHTGPLKRAGGVKGREFTDSVDGNFDRISFELDPKYGTDEELIQLSRIAAAHNAVTIEDSIPSHLGKGADWRLAEMGYGDYPGIFHMVSIREEDWCLLPDVPPDREVLNLSPSDVDRLRDKHYIVGQLQRVIFFEPGVKETDWSVTAPIVGYDGIVRRWVYLHYFKEGQPSLNWLDPTFAAHQLVVGDALHAIDVIGARGMRLDANGFLGVERKSDGTAWSESHPLSLTGNQLLAGMIRKAGGFSFQELNLTLDDIALMSKGGADLSYDFITRPAYQHALLTGRTEFLRLMLKLMRDFEIDPASLIHGLQNHDELTTELVHFWTLHANESFTYQGQTLPGNILREHIREEMYELLSGERAPYNLRFVTNGISCTTVSIITAALGIRDLSKISSADIEKIKKVHLLLAMYNAMQPGVFAVSGWDLAGLLPLDPDQVGDRLRDGDTRWIHRGAYDLADIAPEAEVSLEGLPRAHSLYGNVSEQLLQSDSFVNRLKRLLAVRQAYGIATSRQILIPDVAQEGLLVMVHELPASKGIQVTALNFSDENIKEIVHLQGVSPGTVVDMINEQIEGELTEDGEFELNLEPYEGLSLRVIYSTSVG